MANRFSRYWLPVIFITWKGKTCWPWTGKKAYTVITENPGQAKDVAGSFLKTSEAPIVPSRMVMQSSMPFVHCSRFYWQYSGAHPNLFGHVSKEAEITAQNVEDNLDGTPLPEDNRFMLLDGEPDGYRCGTGGYLLLRR